MGMKMDAGVDQYGRTIERELDAPGAVRCADCLRDVLAEVVVGQAAASRAAAAPHHRWIVVEPHVLDLDGRAWCLACYEGGRYGQFAAA